MFTGIIESVVDVLGQGHGRLTVRMPRSFQDVRVGSSICVSGVCLTVVQLKQDSMVFDVVPETLRRTILGSVKVGDRVNLERAMKMGDRFEGHIVQGHVEAVGEILSLSQEGPTRSKDGMLKLVYPKHLKGFIVEKGSIAIDGVSLTVAKLHANQCAVALIPHTLRGTTLSVLKNGDRVNIETDVLARYMQRRDSEF